MVGIKKLAYGCILRSQCVAFYFCVTATLMTLSSDLVSGIFASGAYAMSMSSIPFLGHCDLNDLDLVSRIIVS